MDYKQTIAKVLKKKMQAIKDTTIDYHLNWLLNSGANLLEKYKDGKIEREECVEEYLKAEDATRAKLPEAIEDYLKEAREKFYQAIELLEDSSTK